MTESGHWTWSSLALLAVLGLVSCARDETGLVVRLVPNPEVNTTAQLRAVVDRLDVVLAAEGGFESLDAEEGDSLGPYLVTDFDGDGVLDLVLSRPGSVALEPFALTPGRQGDRTLRVTARGLDSTGSLVALGGGAGAFRAGEQTAVELPFNIVPDRRPLRVVAVMPPDGARDLEPLLDGISVELGGFVLAAALEGHLHIVDEDFDERLEPALVLSYLETGMGRVTTVRVFECPLPPGSYTLVVGTGVCTRTGQCLDQHPGIDGAQPFEARFSVRGLPEPASCATAVELVGGLCPEEPCPEGWACEDGVCVSGGRGVPEGVTGGPGCDEQLCAPPLLVCDGELCVADCRLYGVCLDPGQVCELETGLCR